MQANSLHSGVIVHSGAELGGRQSRRKASLIWLTFSDLSRIAPERSSA